ncbi:ATP-binding cassette domain-containing protein [Sphingomonas sp. IC-11]|uniref:ATP-binding cassette domain-containing protein n=1 Tax=Sphingomonas sp. IC-11 TaxID=2898528 RepID=UPI001E40CEE8|nr:ATP-binding cassette domain-containing protein [Sphingomonas sp. IC-11]MCD2315267.1 ATP-binding cassette domain-containing protein [Sphingomonas sp. IC-11]
MTELAALIAGESARERRSLVRAAILASLVAAASVALLGLSGWFITAAALAGAAGTAAAMAFNYMLPSATIRLLAIMRTGARYGEALASHAAALGAVAGVRPAIYRGIAALPIRQALAVTGGEATARAVNDLTAIEHDLVRRSAGPAAVSALLSGAALAAIGGIMPGVLIVAIAAGVLLIMRRLVRPLVEHAAAAQAHNGDLKDRMGHLLESAPELRCFGLEQQAGEEIRRVADALSEAQLACADVHARVSLLHVVAIGSSAAVVFVLTAGAGAPIAAMAALAAAMTIDGLAPLIRRIAARPEVRSAETRLNDLLGNEEGAGSMRLASPALAFETGVPLSSVGRMAITGASGSGKTTLIETLVGLRPAKAGTAWIDGVDIAYVAPETLRSAFAWLPQDAALISGTVRDNLLIADSRASEDALWAVLADAAIEARVRALPRGLDTWIGENGERLSGGERRRIALARAYLRPAPWLLLDEPTESLDAATEAEVIDRLERRLQRTGQGLLLASHRPLPHRLCAQSRSVEPA